MSVLYTRILELRHKHDLSAYAVEKGASLTIGSLKTWQTSMPSGDKILRVANFLDVSVDYLLGNSDNPKSHTNHPDDLVLSVDDFSKIVDSFSTAAAQAVSKVHEDIEKMLKSNHIQLANTQKTEKNSPPEDDE